MLHRRASGSSALVAVRLLAVRFHKSFGLLSGQYLLRVAEPMLTYRRLRCAVWRRHWPAAQ